MKTILAILFSISFLFFSCKENTNAPKLATTKESVWIGWNHFCIDRKDTATRYGYELISNTAYYLGPKGKVKQISNGMNCQNCHLKAGTVPWGNNYGAVASTYPKYRDRSSSVESIAKRVNDCFERSLNGKALDTSSKEMQAIIAYLKWVGSDVPKGKKPMGSGIADLPFLNRAADKLKGEKVYNTFCVRCHGKNGEGQMNASGYGYDYPPLWGNNSYNIGAGIFRLSRLAGFVKNNMPYLEATYNNPVLTDGEAWDVAAYINSQARPQKNISADWHNISKKPFDHPFAPYADSFSETQHKYGPFQPIIDFKNSNSKRQKCLFVN